MSKQAFFLDLNGTVVTRVLVESLGMGTRYHFLTIRKYEGRLRHCERWRHACRCMTRGLLVG
jgi:hypothetical protein